VNGDLDLSICAIVHNVPRSCYPFALCLCFVADVCTIDPRHDQRTEAGKLSRRAATTGREGYDCANSGDSWFHAEGLCTGAVIKVSDSLQDPMWFASAGGKQDIRAFVARRLQV